MSINIQFEAQLIGLSFLTGAGLMFTYDVLRVFRIVIPHHFMWIGLEDIVYWIYASFVTFSLLYQQNDGGLRGYVILGVFLGMILYNELISRYFFKIIKKIQGYLKMRLVNFRNRKREK